MFFQIQKLLQQQNESSKTVNVILKVLKVQK